MKKFENKTTGIQKSMKADDCMTFAEIGIECINNTPEGGFTPDEMRSRLRVIDNLKSAETEIQIEDADFEKLKQCVNSMKWAVMDQDIVDFTDLINEK